MELSEWPVVRLAEYCKKETEKYFLKKKSNSCYCYTLFCRAFAEDSSTALNYLYTIYRPLVMDWINKHTYRNAIQCDDSELFFDSMSRFIFAMKQHNLEQFPSLAHVLSYMRKCVHSVITNLRRKAGVPAEPLDENLTAAAVHRDSLDEQILLKESWQRIEQVLIDGKELLLARLLFTQNLRPREILKEFPGQWQDTNEIRVDCQRIKRKLRKDKILLSLLGIAELNKDNM